MSLTQDPREVWLSEHFRLSDFLGNHSVYARGLANAFCGGDLHLRNGQALCTHALEPILRSMGPISVSYGFICDEFSRRTVRYMDPTAPSNHRWDLGAAADILVHGWITETPNGTGDVSTSPALLAHTLSASGLPYRRMITYSESPYLCLAVKADEVERRQPLRSFYENAYEGKPAAKPKYTSFALESARQRRHRELEEHGLPHPWYGVGFPTYHGGGAKQYQHTRVSKYTMLLDWLVDLQSISDGHHNIPPLHNEEVLDALAAAGAVYDYLLAALLRPRLSILQGFLCRTHPNFIPELEWSGPTISIEIGGKRYETAEGLCDAIASMVAVAPPWSLQKTAYGARLVFDKHEILSWMARRS